jgi:DMSO/TMAO reductase YedYZ molybdopterin-dependent catalytic subunit
LAVSADGGKDGGGMGRRLFLKASACFAFLAAIPSWAWAFFLKELQVRTVEKETFHFDPASGRVEWTGRKGGEPYKLLVDGLVEKFAAFSYNDLRALPQVIQVSDFYCVEGWSVKEIEWGGFRFEEILRKVKVRPEARYITFHSLGATSPLPGLDHYVESFPLSQLLDPKKEMLLALSMNGKPLSHDHGAPLRVVSPYDLGYKGSKYVTRIEFAKERQPGWWTVANPVYGIEGPVAKERLRKKG